MPQITWGRRAPLSVESVGHALLVRLPGQQARQARAFAAGLLADPEHRIVVLDLPAGSGPSDCRAAAHLLARVPGPMRLVFGRPPAGDTLSIGTWFSRRLARTVVLADGPLEAGRGGSLFVRPGTGAGWVRFTPDTDPEHIALRHPRPGWEPLLHERTWRVGRSTTVEPLPAGVWLHGPGDEDSYAAHRSRLVADLQLHPDLLPVVVGAPGTAPPPLDEVARYVDSLRAAVRPALRFFGFGPAGRVSEPLGQALADVLQRPVDCFAGLPTGDWHRRECRLIDADGVATWQSYAHELRFLPRAAAGDPAPAPVVLSHRAPLPGLTEVGPGVYSLAPDAVVEVVQSGLWVRGSEDPPGAAAVRRLPPDPERASVLHSLLPGPCERRFRELAHKVLLGLDDETRALSLLVPAPADAVPARYGLALGSTWASQALPVASTEAVRPAGRTAGEAMGRGPEPAPAPQTGAAEALWGIDGTPAHGTAVLGTPVAEPTVYAASVESEASLPASAGIPAAELVGGPVPVLPTAPAEPASSVLGTEKAAPEAATAPPVPPPSAAAAPDLVTSSLLLSGDYALFGVAPEPEENPPVPVPPVEPDAAVETAEIPPSPSEPPARDLAPAGPGPTSAEATPGLLDAAGLAAQPVPAAEASAAVVAGGPEPHRDELRTALGTAFDSAHSTVREIMSEIPGLRGIGPDADSIGGADVDLAAARLYLIGSMQELDALLCAGAPGTHVGRGRCVTAGLRRLPSYRGAAWARVSIGGSGGAWFAGRDTVDDWGWTTAFTRADGSAEGDTDLLIWSATARRTAVLDRDFPTRVVFLPGTRFQVLDVREDGPRRTVLLREVAVAEPDAPGVEPGALSPRAAVAVAGLDRAATAWSEAPGRPPGRPASALPVQMRAPGVLPGVMDVPAIGTSISG